MLKIYEAIPVAVCDISEKHQAAYLAATDRRFRRNFRPVFCLSFSWGLR
jgi:hypothetical protein